MPSLRRFFPAFTVVVSLVVLYFYGLTKVGVLSTDEPRYAAIGQAMARTGDIVTPRLWGSPWFEKPPALYWMTALATRIGAGPELAARLPVALLSLTFLGIYFVLLQREFGRSPAVLASAMLATSAGWLAYSDLCLTDIPLAVFFSMAVLLALPLVGSQRQPLRISARMAVIGAFLGLGVLAKGLVPLALALPFFWFLREHRSSWWIAAVSCLAVAGPWYFAVYLQNGSAFVDEFFIRHHFERLYSASLEHVQPWYYYLPVLLAGLFPWTPSLALLPARTLRRDLRLQFLAIVFLFGFLLFSASRNKLPGYILPLLPSVFVLFAYRFRDLPLSLVSKPWLWACALLIACIPLIAGILPDTLAVGRISFAGFRPDKTAAFYAVAPLLVMLFGRRGWLVPLLLLCIVGSGLYLKAACFPILDRQVSARFVWKQIEPYSNELCDGGTNRAWIYGLNFYRGSAIPYCTDNRPGYMIRSEGHSLPVFSRYPNTTRP